MNNIDFSKAVYHKFEGDRSIMRDGIEELLKEYYPVNYDIVEFMVFKNEDKSIWYKSERDLDDSERGNKFWKRFYLHNEINRNEPIDDDYVNTTIYPDVICRCNNIEFRLDYNGGYNLDATCTQCGLRDSVYSG